MKFHLRIKPFVSAGEVFVHGNGTTWEILPLSVFESTKSLIVRIGRSTYWFDDTGKYDGPEFSCEAMAPPEVAALSKALGDCKDNRGRSPSYAYFSEGTPGWRNETALWPTKSELRGPVDAPPLAPPAVFARLCDCGWMLPASIAVSTEVPGITVKIVCPRCSKQWGSDNEAGAS